MADPLSMTAAITGLTVTAYNLAKAICSTISAIKSAPIHISGMRKELRSFYNVLATLQQILDDNQTAAKDIELRASDNLQTVLEDCVALFKRVQTLVNAFTEFDGNENGVKWKSIRWNFREADVNSMKRDLADRKLTLNTELLVAIFYNLRTANLARDTIEQQTLSLQKEEAEYRRELEEKLPAISKELEDLQAAQMPGGPPHSETDRAEVRFDTTYTLRHYLDSAASILTATPPIETPSMQVSNIDYDLESIETITLSDHLSDHRSFKTALSRLSPPVLSSPTAQSTINANVSSFAHILFGHQTAGSTGVVASSSPSRADLQFEAWIQVPGIKRFKVDMRFGDKVGDLKIRAKNTVETSEISFKDLPLSYKCERLADEETVDAYICTTTPTFWLRPPIDTTVNFQQILPSPEIAKSSPRPEVVKPSARTTMQLGKTVNGPESLQIKKRKKSSKPRSKQSFYMRLNSKYLS